jgi:hypothetical protein
MAPPLRGHLYFIDPGAQNYRDRISIIRDTISSWIPAFAGIQEDKIFRFAQMRERRKPDPVDVL